MTGCQSNWPVGRAAASGQATNIDYGYSQCPDTDKLQGDFSMLRRPLILGLLGLAIAGSMSWYMASPHWALSKLRDAAMAGDKTELARLIDFPALRHSIKLELREGIAGVPDRTNGPLAELGGDIAVTLADPLVENMVTPGGIKSLVALGKLASADSSPEKTSTQQQWTIDRDGIDRFYAAPATSEATSREGGARRLIFRRDGLGWKLAGIDPTGGPQ